MIVGKNRGEEFELRGIIYLVDDGENSHIIIYIKIDNLLHPEIVGKYF